MGTRHLVCVVQNGEFKVAQYGQFDGYPSGAGKDVWKFIFDNLVLRQSSFREDISRVRWIRDEEVQATLDDILGTDNEGWMTMEQSKQWQEKYPHLSRETSVGVLDVILELHGEVALQDSSSFAGDSLFCEWAYVIDLDQNQLEVYKGFNKQPVPAGERFADYEPDKNPDGTFTYYPIRLLTIFPFEAFPTFPEFLQGCGSREEEE